MIDRATFVQALAAAVAAPATPPPAERSFNVLVLGDSIAWGQGLRPEHRWRTLLIDYLTKTLKQPVREIPTELHSGAIIGIGDRNQIGLPGLYQPGETEPSFLDKGPYAGEIPSGTPTVLAELDALDASPEKDTPIDLIVLSAGINDVRITRLLDPLARDEYIAALIDLHCHRHLTALLDRIRTRCVERNPGCRVAVLSYFRMVSKDSTKFPSVYDFVSALLSQPPRSRAERRRERIIQGLAKISEGKHEANTPYATYADLPEIVRGIIDAAGRFYAESEAAIGAAVDDANRAPFTPAFVHVTPRISDGQAVFVAPPNSSSLWELRFADRAVFPVDEVYAERDELCRQLYSPEKAPASLNECRIASIGHPDVVGAQQGYFDAILAAIASVAR